MDFPKGEKQMHMEYSLSEVAKTTNMTYIQRLALIYDIMCEYGVNLDSRFLNHIGLMLPNGLDIVKVIGLFHAHGHKEVCLYQYATIYIPDLAVVNGEILETL
jgi:hypothetical protein